MNLALNKIMNGVQLFCNYSYHATKNSNVNLNKRHNCFPEI